MHRLQERSTKDFFSHDALSWIDLVHQLDFRTRAFASGCPMVVMVQPTHDGKSDHLVSRILRGRTQSALFRDLLPNPLMRSCLVEVRHIRIEDALELPLMKDQQVVEAFLPHTPHEAFTDRIRSGSVVRSLENLDVTCRRHPDETGSKLAIVITEQILRCLPIRRGFPKLLRNPGIGRRSCDSNMDYPA